MVVKQIDRKIDNRDSVLQIFISTSVSQIFISNSVSQIFISTSVLQPAATGPWCTSGPNKVERGCVSEGLNRRNLSFNWQDPQPFC